MFAYLKRSFSGNFASRTRRQAGWVLVKSLLMPLSDCVNPSNVEAILSSKVQGDKDFGKPSKPCHVGIHLKALAEHSQMSTHLPGYK